MSAISVYLDAVLNAWLSDRGRRQKLVTGWKEELLVAGRELDERRDAIRQTRTLEMDQLRGLLDVNERRWEERLVRVDEWNAALQELRSNHDELIRLGARVQWVEKVAVREPRWSARFQRQIERLQSEQTVFHDSLSRWTSILVPRLQNLARFEQRSSDRGPMVVSRAVLDPERQFVMIEGRHQGRLLEQMAALRQGVNRLLNRLDWLERALPTGMSEFVNATQLHLKERLQEFRQSLIQIRYHVLSDALDLESAKRSFRSIELIVQKLRCLEDVSRRPSLWDRLFSSDY